eukprot:COSAG01_NODE_6856_length_3468_cov_1.978629_2_plen_56_part_00
MASQGNLSQLIPALMSVLLRWLSTGADDDEDLPEFGAPPMFSEGESGGEGEVRAG